MCGEESKTCRTITIISEALRDLLDPETLRSYSNLSLTDKLIAISRESVSAIQVINEEVDQDDDNDFIVDSVAIRQRTRELAKVSDRLLEAALAPGESIESICEKLEESINILNEISPDC